MQSNQLTLRLAEFLKSRQNAIAADCATLVQEQSDPAGAPAAGFPWKQRLTLMLQNVADSLFAMTSGEAPPTAGTEDHSDGVEIQYLFLEASLVRNAFVRALNRFQADQSGKKDFTVLDMTELRQDALDHFDNRVAAELSQWIAGRGSAAHAAAHASEELQREAAAVAELLERSLRAPQPAKDQAIIKAVQRLRGFGGRPAAAQPAPVSEPPARPQESSRRPVEGVALHPLDVRAFTAHLMETFEPLAKRKGLGFEVRTQDGLLVVRTDATKLHKAVSSLVTSVINACRSGRISLAVERAQAQPQVQTWSLSIKSAGSGIPADQVAGILRSSGASVREIIEALGGSLETGATGEDGCLMAMTFPIGM